MGRAQSPVYRVLAPLLSPLSPPRKLSVVLLFMDIHFFLRLYLFIFRQWGRVGERERERNINVWLLLTRPQVEIWPTTQACAPTGNQTSSPLVLRPALNLLSYTSQDYNFNFSLKRKLFHPDPEGRGKFSSLGMQLDLALISSHQWPHQVMP